MTHNRTKTAHLQFIEACKRRGKDWRALVAKSVRENASKPKENLSKQIAAQMLYKESMRKGWKSFIKYGG